MSKAKNFIYGAHSVKECVSLYPSFIQSVYCTQVEKLQDMVLPEQIPVHVISAKEIQQKFQIKEFESHQGIVAHLTDSLDNILGMSLERLLVEKQSPNMVILPDIQDQHNLGAIARSCVAFEQVSAIMYCSRSINKITPVIAKVSAGTVFHLILNKAMNLNRSIQTLLEHDYTIIGLEKREHSVPLQEVDFNESLPYALIIGSEDRGIPRALQKYINQSVYIPQSDKVDSLNMSVATAITLHKSYLDTTLLK